MTEASKPDVRQAPPAPTRAKARTGRRWLTTIYTAIYTAGAVLALSACGGGGGDDEEAAADGQQRTPPVNCAARPELCA